MTQAREPRQKSATLSPHAAPICNIDHINSVRRLSSPFSAHMSLQQSTTLTIYLQSAAQQPRNFTSRRFNSAPQSHTSHTAHTILQRDTWIRLAVARFNPQLFSCPNSAFQFSPCSAPARHGNTNQESRRLFSKSFSEPTVYTRG
jgi:hypothetical protein